MPCAAGSRLLPLGSVIVNVRSVNILWNIFVDNAYRRRYFPPPLKKFVGIKMENNKPQYFDDDGNEVNPDLVPKPDLCITCKKENIPGKE